MHFTKFVLSGVLGLCLACSAMGQTTAPAETQAAQDTQVEPAKKGKKGKKEGKRSPGAIAAAQQLRAFKTLDLSDAQTASMQEVIKKHLPAITAVRAKLTALVSPEQRKQLGTAMKAARKSGLAGPEARAEAFKSLGLNEEATKSYASAQAEVKTLTEKIQTELMGQLTDEQREKFKAAGKGAGKSAGKGKKGKGKPGAAVKKKKGGKKKKAAAEDEEAELMD